MSVYQHPDGRWVCDYPKGQDRERPNTKRKYFGRGRDAENAAREFNAALGLGVRKNEHSPLFVELVNAYQSAKQYSLARSTFDNFTIKMENIILPEIGQMMAHQITPALLDQYVNKRGGEGVKMTTVHRELSDIRAVIKWSADRRLIADNPMSGFSLPKRDDARIQPPTRAEFQAILDKAVPHLKRAMLIAWHTGIRPGKEELLCLTWESVDFHNRTLTVVSADKGGLPVRMIPLNKTILGHLEQWYDEDLKHGYRYIAHYHGAKIDKIEKAWQAAKRRARVTRRLRMYDIRHAFITDLLEKGADLKSVSEIAGHASPDMTLRVYQHVSSELKRQAVDLRE